ncbi:MAG: nucleotidyltransferase domain-containing protein [Planctomycetota bacterium]|nr:nucleotidyltransferase domain-containing protein [Planctomycetota bacterium]
MSKLVENKILQGELLEEIWEKHPFVISAWHFGSTLRGDARPESDVDIAVLTETTGEDIILELAQLENDIARQLGGAAIDLVVLNEQAVVFQHKVLATGKLIYDCKPQQRALFQAQVISWYCDFLPTLKLFEKYRLKGLRRRAGIR